MNEKTSKNCVQHYQLSLVQKFLTGINHVKYKNINLNYV